MSMILVAASVLVSCQEDPLPPVDSFRFGQVGEVRVTVVEPLLFGVGSVQQVLTWNSQGPWTLYEQIDYRGELGDDASLRNRGDDVAYAAAYAALIATVNDNENLSLFIPELDPSLNPDCGVDESTVTFRIRDDLRGEEISWSRCDHGPLGGLTPVGSGPDAEAARVILAAILARDLSLSPSWVSDFQSSLPFGTLDRGEDSGIDDLVSRAFIGEEGSSEAPAEWAGFWAAHSDGQPLPEVNWAEDMVLVAGDGVRNEAGDSLEVRRVLQVTGGGLAEPVERAPGDFCSPAFRPHTPFHIVFAPRVPPPVLFATLKVERVPCGT
jgi:hypothetical protein